MFKILAAIVPVLLLAGGCLYKRIDMFSGVTEAVYPPTNKSAGVFEMYTGKKVTTRGIAAAIIELCNEGVLKLALNGDRLDVLKIKDYGKYDPIKKKIVDYMFENNNEVAGFDDGIIAYPVYHLTERSMSDDITGWLLSELNRKTESRKTRRYVNAGKKSVLMLLASYEICVSVVLMILPRFELIIVGLFVGIFICAGFKMIDENINASSFFNLLFSIIWNGFVFFWICGFFKDMISFGILLEAVISAVIFLYMLLWKKEDYENECNRQLYKRFIRLLKKNKKSEKINNKYSRANPKRIYEVLPYVCAVGKHKQWIEQHKDIPCDVPAWIVSDKEFDYDVLQECVDKLVTATMSR